VNIGDEEEVVVVEPVEDPAHRDEPAPARQPDELEPDPVVVVDSLTGLFGGSPELPERYVEIRHTRRPR
jgi:hypothetical protein